MTARPLYCPLNRWRLAANGSVCKSAVPCRVTPSNHAVSSYRPPAFGHTANHLALRLPDLALPPRSECLRPTEGTRGQQMSATPPNGPPKKRSSKWLLRGAAQSLEWSVPQTATVTRPHPTRAPAVPAQRGSAEIRRQPTRPCATGTFKPTLANSPALPMGHAIAVAVASRRFLFGRGGFFR